MVSGIAVVDAGAGAAHGARATTRVRFRALDDATLDWYVATREWQGRAGGYAIQGRGAALVAAIEGDYLNVVGLPVAALLELLPGILHGSSLTLRFAASSRQCDSLRCSPGVRPPSATLRPGTGPPRSARHPASHRGLSLTSPSYYAWASSAT